MEEVAPDEQARLEALVGRVLGDKFRLRACIGIGGSGAVYRADQIALGRTVAVKILSSQLASDPKLVKRFQDEALAASRLNHANTVSVIDYGQTPDGLLYLAMEYVKGPTLTQLLVDKHPLPLDRVLDIVQQLLAGIEEAHLGGVVHADLKCDNVILDQRRSDWDVVKVVDFGIARLVNVPLGTDERSICGTPEYMAPEVITGAPPAFASDLYAVGIIFYELLTQKTPFVGGGTIEILTRQLKEPPTPPSQRRPGEVPSDIEAVVLKALSKHPTERYADAAQFRNAVQRLRDVRKTHRSANLATCEACDAQIPARFRFCPECGQARQAVFSDSGIVPLAKIEEQVAAQQSASPPVTTPAPELALPLVGRDDVLDTLVRHLSTTGTPALLHVIGPSGSGRSQLLREAYQRVTDGAGVLIYQASPDPTGLETPLYPIRAVAAAILRLPPVCTLDILARAAVELGLNERDLPGLAELFGHPGSLADLEPLVRRREMIASAVRALHAAARDRPLAVVFENIDRCDHPSQELIRRLGERADERPSLRIIVTSGPDLATQWRAAAEVTLEPLDADALGQIASMLARTELPDPPGARTLFDVTGGMPGHLEHLIYYLHEGGSVADAGTSVPDLVAARLSLLPQSVLELAQYAAVFGIEVERDLLIRVSELPPRAFENTLAALRQRQLVFDDGAVIGFATSMIRDIVYDATPADVRRALHRTAFELLSQVTSEPAVLGHHADLAGIEDVAADHLMRAGDRSAHFLDDAGACTLYQRALRAARVVLYTSDEERDVQRYTELSVKLADALCASGQLGLARGVLDEAKPWTSGMARLEALIGRTTARLALGDDDLAGATTAQRKAIGMAIASGDGTLIADLYLDLATMLTRAGDAEAARRELEEGIDLVTLGEGMSARGGPPELWRMLVRLAQLASGTGDHARALTVGEHALQHAHRVGSRLGSARIQVMLASECDRLNDADKAERYRAAAIAELRELGDRRSTAELLLAVVSTTRTLLRITPPSLASEARTLASEVGWKEGTTTPEPS